MKTLYLLDASSFIYRSFFALPPLKTKEGFPTGAVFGFLRTLLSIIKSERPRYLVVVFDHPAPTKRDKVFKEYKAGRPAMPDPLKVQIPVIKEALHLMGIPTLEVEGYEADDLIAMLTKKLVQKGFRVKIYTPDKDMLQLVNSNVVVVNPMTGELFTEEKVREKFGVPPQKVADYLALVGDKIDNIPGIKGVGPKRAVELIKRFGGVEGILNRWEEFSKIYPDAKREELEMSYYLVKPITDAEIDIDEESLKIGKPNMEALKSLLGKLEMKSLIKDIDKVLRTSTQGSLF
jgi:DNA polymerase-1